MYIWLPQRGMLHFHFPRKFPWNLTQVQAIHPVTFLQHYTFLLIVNQHHSTPDPPEPFIHLSPALVCRSIPLPCLLLQAALVTPHHHTIQAPPLLLHLVTLWTFPYLDIATIPCTLHIIEDNATSPLAHYPISASRTWILYFRHWLSHPVFTCKTHQCLPNHFIKNAIWLTFTFASRHTLPTSCIYLQLAVTFASCCY